MPSEQKHGGSPSIAEILVAVLEQIFLKESEFSLTRRRRDSSHVTLLCRGDSSLGGFVHPR